ncbi:WN11B protein, partial [Regulus satrapa]|nr:WN11B protein [Regulus satrapa]
SGVAWNESQHCRLLVPEQLQLCRRHLEVMPSMVRAARRTQALCQQSFADMRWNCSSIRRAPSFGPDLLTGKGMLLPPSPPSRCSRSARPGSVPRAGSGFSRLAPALDFCFGVNIPPLRGLFLPMKCPMDAPGSQSRGGTRREQSHLFPCALQVLSDSLDTRCKCHGVSGSCSVKTCWKGLPDLGEIASDLKSRYLAALKVTHRLMGPRKQLIPKEGDARPVTEMDLVYLINSPDYCTPNPQLGSLGTQDRPCNRSSLGSDSCDLLCCGRGYNTYTEEVQERCHCRYRWCCSVVCRRCRRSLERHVCK